MAAKAAAGGAGAPAPAPAAAPATKDLPAIEAVEEDDEFVEFENENWAAEDETKEDPTMWQDDWDDDNLEDDFCVQLRAELGKTAAMLEGKGGAAVATSTAGGAAGGAGGR